MEYEPLNGDNLTDLGRKIARQPTYQPKLSPWFDLRVFYVRVSNCEVDELTPEFLTLNHIPLDPDTLLEVNGRRSSIYSDSFSSLLRRDSNCEVDELTPEFLTLNHIPLDPDTLLEVNGRRSSIYSDSFSSLLRRDRVDKKSEEATFVSTDSIRMTGSVKFEVYDRDDLLLTGVLEMCNGNGFNNGESKNHSKRWSMKCQSAVAGSAGFLRGKQFMGSESILPMVEVYVTGCFAGTPIILTKTLQLIVRRKHVRKGMLDSIPEYETTATKTDVPSELALQLAEFRDYKTENNDEVEDYNSLYSRAEYMENEDGELSWFNAGVRVGVGIGLGICLGIGIGVGLLVRTYQATTRNFKRRL